MRFHQHAVGLDRSYLAELETRKIEICLRNLELIAQSLGMETWNLLKFPKAAKSHVN